MWEGVFGCYHLHFNFNFTYLCDVLDLVDAYALDNDDYSEELEEVHGDIQDTLEADNYEDQLPQPEVSRTLLILWNWTFDLFSIDHTGRRIDN